MSDNNPSQFIIYQSEAGETKLDVRFVDETVWLTQALMAELFSTSKQNIFLEQEFIDFCPRSHAGAWESEDPIKKA